MCSIVVHFPECVSYGCPKSRTQLEECIQLGSGDALEANDLFFARNEDMLMKEHSEARNKLREVFFLLFAYRNMTFSVAARHEPNTVRPSSNT